VGARGASTAVSGPVSPVPACFLHLLLGIVRVCQSGTTTTGYCQHSGPASHARRNGPSCRWS
jgi:hypothetical protein